MTPETAVRVAVAQPLGPRTSPSAWPRGVRRCYGGARAFAGLTCEPRAAQGAVQRPSPVIQQLPPRVMKNGRSSASAGQLQAMVSMPGCLHLEHGGGQAWGRLAGPARPLKFGHVGQQHVSYTARNVPGEVSVDRTISPSGQVETPRPRRDNIVPSTCVTEP